MVDGFADVALVVLREDRACARPRPRRGRCRERVRTQPLTIIARADRAHAAIDLREDFIDHFVERRGLAQVANALRQVVAKQEEVLLEALLRPALDALLDRVDHDRRQRGGEDDRALVAGVPGIIVDDLLQRIAGGREDRRDAERDHREIDRAADRDLRVVQAIAEQRDRRPSWRNERGKREADARRPSRPAAAGRSCRSTI